MTPTGFSEDEEPPRDEDKEEKKDGRLSPIKEEEALEKIAAVDDILEPDSLADMLKQLRSLIENQSKISAKKIKMSLIEAGLEKLKNNMRNMSENEIRNKRLDVLANFIEKVLIGDRMNDMTP